MGGTHTAKCKWCGKKYQKGNNALVFIKLGSDFCSTKCESEYNHSENLKGKPSKSINTSKDKNPELERIKWEKEKAEKQEAEEKKAKREAKANELEKQGRPFMAFVTINQDSIGVGVLITLATILPMVFVMAGIVVGIIVSTIVIGILAFGIYKYLNEMFRKTE